MFTGWERPSHWLVLAVVVLVLFGYKKLPDMSRSVGRSLRIFKTEMKGLNDDDAARDATNDATAAAATPPVVVQPVVVVPPAAAPSAAPAPPANAAPVNAAPVAPTPANGAPVAAPGVGPDGVAPAAPSQSTT
jgi:sec-independent protein translocase protein TatA